MLCECGACPHPAALIGAAAHWPERGALVASISAPGPSASRCSPIPIFARLASGDSGPCSARPSSRTPRACSPSPPRDAGRFRARPAHQHGRKRGTARAIHPRVCRRRFFGTEHQPGHCLVGRASISTAAVGNADLIGTDMGRGAKVIDEHAMIFILPGWAVDRLSSLRAKQSNPIAAKGGVDCFVAEPVTGRVRATRSLVAMTEDFCCRTRPAGWSPPPRPDLEAMHDVVARSNGSDQDEIHRQEPDQNAWGEKKQ